MTYNKSVQRGHFAALFELRKSLRAIIRNSNKAAKRRLTLTLAVIEKSSGINVMVECEKCFKYYNPVISRECRLCNSYSFQENIFCDLTRSAQETTNIIECYAHKPNLSVIGESQDIYRDANFDNETIELPERQKWLKAYALQQLKQNPDKMYSSLNYHVCLITKKREKLFESITENLMTSAIFDKVGGSFNGTLSVLCVGYDHMHLHLESSPDYSVDEVVTRIIESLELTIKKEFHIFSEGKTIFENAYFAETIGS